MLMLYRRQRRPAAASAQSHSERMPLSQIGADNDEYAWDARSYPLDAPTQRMLTAPSQQLPQRRPSRRYRSRNCATFRRYGEHFQFVDADDLDVSTDTTNSAIINSVDGRSLPIRRRRTVRAHNRLLTEELRDVQQRVAELEQRRDLLYSSMLNAHARAVAYAIDTVKQFYVLFANGYRPRTAPQHARRAATFLRAMLSADALCTDFRGVETFLDQYEASSELHSTLRLSLTNVTLLTSESADRTIQIHASAVCSLRIKRATLEQLFPAIVADEAMVQQLIGCEYSLQYDKVFHFCGAHVFQHESRVDLCAGMLALVADPMVALRLINASVMTRHGHLKLDHRVEEDAHAIENAVL